MGNAQNISIAKHSPLSSAQTTPRINFNRNVYMCHTLNDDLMRFKCADLMDHYIAVYLWSGINLPTINPHLNETLAKRVLSSIRTAEIVVAYIDDVNYHYAQCISELGIALALQKPIVILHTVANKNMESTCIWWTRGVIKVSNWYQLRGQLDGISTLMREVEDASSE